MLEGARVFQLLFGFGPDMGLRQDFRQSVLARTVFAAGFAGFSNTGAFRQLRLPLLKRFNTGYCGEKGLFAQALFVSCYPVPKDGPALHPCRYLFTNTRNSGRNRIPSFSV